MRKARLNEYYVFHDDPKYVFQVVWTDKDACIVLNLVTKKEREMTVPYFNEFYTRIPIG